MRNEKSRREQKFPIQIRVGSVVVLIYRTSSHDYEQFTISYYQDGKRKRSSFSSLAKAQGEAARVAACLGSTDAAILKLTGADLSAYQRARQHLDPLRIPIEIAAAEFADARRKLGDVPLSQVVDFFLKRHPKKIEQRSVRQIVAEFIAAKTADGVSTRYIRCLRWALSKFECAFTCDIGEVTGPQVDDWLRELRLSARTRNNLRSVVLTLFGFAKARRYLPKDHDEIEDVPLAKDRGGAIEIFTPAELEEILTCAGDKMTPFIVLGAFAGIRHAEIQRLEWEDIHLDDCIIEIRASKAKTASRRTVPILENLRQWLLPFRKDSGLVCPYSDSAFELKRITRRINRKLRAAWAEQNIVSAADLRRADQVICLQAKTRSKPQRGEIAPGAETAKIEGWQPFVWKHNALRHSYISYRVAEIKNVAQVALEAGNSPQIIHTNYKELVRPVDANRWFKIAPSPTTEAASDLPLAA